MAEQGRALYHRWRPQTFDEVVGQTHVTRTLQNAIATGRVSHAYLFTGPRGTGKTSVARILAKAVNCLSEDAAKPCNQCTACQAINEGRALDLIEIDAASNTGVDDVRDMREKIGFAPNELRYKVYIIDEVHMLSTAAFNALLKTLEEPPAHVIFILATTEVHKVLPTILSRCQRFDFRRLSLKEIVGKLNTICAAEGIHIEPAALELIARAATGSFRDAESILDQLAAFAEETITIDLVQTLLGTAGLQVVEDLVECVIEKDVPRGLRLINKAVDDGVDPRQLARQLLEHLRGLMLLQLDNEQLVNVSAETLERMRTQARRIPHKALIQTIKLFNDAAMGVKGGAHPQLPLELAFVEATMLEEPAHVPAREAPQAAPAGLTHAPAAAPSRPQTTERPTAEKAMPSAPPEAPPEAAPEEEAQPAEPPPAPVGDFDTMLQRWPEVMAGVRKLSRNLEALLKDSRPVSLDGTVFTLGFYYPFHKQKVEEPKSKALVEQVLQQLFGTSYTLRCVLIPKDARQVELERPKTKFDLAAEDPVVREAVKRYGARIVDVHTE